MQQPPQSQQPHPLPSGGRGDPISGIIGELQTSWNLFTDRRVPVYAKALPALVGLVYLLMPVDILPDPLLGLGQVDDLGLLAIMMIVFRFLAGASTGTMMLAGRQSQPPERSGLIDEDELAGAGDTSTGTFWPEGGQPQGGGGGGQAGPPRVNYNIYSPHASGRGYCGLAVLAIVLLIVGVVVWPPVRDTLCWAAPWISPDLIPPFCPKPREPIDTVILRTLQTVSKLELVNNTSADIMDVEFHGCIFGTERLLYIAKGKAIVGIDLEKLSRDDIKVDEMNKSAALILPPPIVFDSFLDIDNSYVYDVRIPLGCPNATVDMIQTAQVRFREQLEGTAQSEDMLEIAKKHALSVVTLFLTELGFTDISVAFSTQEAEVESQSAAADTAQPSETPAPPPTPIDTPVPASTPVPAETISP